MYKTYHLLRRAKSNLTPFYGSVRILYLAAFIALMMLGEPSRAERADLFDRNLVQTGKEPVLKTEFIYETAPFPSSHASTIVEVKGNLIAAWFGGTDERKPDVGIWVSRFDGKRWSPVTEVANGVQKDGTRYPCWNPVLF